MSDIIEIKVDSRQVVEILNRLAATASDMTPAMGRVAGVMLRAVQVAFANEADPATGQKWPALKRSTIKRREKEGHVPIKILQVMGALALSVHAEHGGESAVVGTNLRYARIHQLGGEITHAARSVTVRLRTNAKDELLRQKDYPHLAVFAAGHHKRAKISHATIEAHTTHMPARPFLGFSPAAMAEILTILTQEFQRVASRG